MQAFRNYTVCFHFKLSLPKSPARWNNMSHPPSLFIQNNKDYLKYLNHSITHSHLLLTQFGQRVFLQCCPSPRSFTVVVLMRDESGYMMLLLLLPFHQQQTPTYTQQKQKWYGGIPPWQRASSPHKQGRLSVSKLEERPARGLFAKLDPVFIAPALDAFLALQALGRAWH